jgi:hypothetical protein
MNCTKFIKNDSSLTESDLIKSIESSRINLILLDFRLE